MNSQLFKQLKVESKLHTPTYLIIKYEFEGIRLTEDVIEQVKRCKDYGELQESVK